MQFYEKFIKDKPQRLSGLDTQTWIYALNLLNYQIGEVFFILTLNYLAFHADICVNFQKLSGAGRRGLYKFDNATQAFVLRPKLAHQAYDFNL